MQKLKNWLPAIIVMTIIFIASSTPGQTINEYGLNKESIQISGHFWFYVFLCFAYYKATKNVVNSILLAILYACTDEFHQIFTPLRSVSLFDIGVDTVAATLTGISLWKLQPHLPQKLRNWLNN